MKGFIILERPMMAGKVGKLDLYILTEGREAPTEVHFSKAWKDRYGKDGKFTDPEVTRGTSIISPEEVSEEDLVFELTDTESDAVQSYLEARARLMGYFTGHLNNRKEELEKPYRIS